MIYKCECGAKTLKLEIDNTKESTIITYNCDTCKYYNKYVFGGQNEKR